jgi:hypothetical protein
MGSIAQTIDVHDDGDSVVTPQVLTEIQKRYKLEHDKRLRADGRGQFADLYSIPKFSRFKQDPWANSSDYAALPRAADGERREILIMGTGFAGLLFAVRLIQAGFKREDLQFIDTAAGILAL